MPPPADPLNLAGRRMAIKGTSFRNEADLMIKRALYIFTPVVLLAGCSGNVQNPVDRITFRDEPLVRDVETGMSQEQVLAIGGEPSKAAARTVAPGICHDYCGMQIKFHPNGNDLLGWLGSSLPDLYLKSHPNASQRPSNGRKTPEPCE